MALAAFYGTWMAMFTGTIGLLVVGSWRKYALFLTLAFVPAGTYALSMWLSPSYPGDYNSWIPLLGIYALVLAAMLVIAVFKALHLLYMRQIRQG